MGLLTMMTVCPWGMVRHLVSPMALIWGSITKVSISRCYCREMRVTKSYGRTTILHLTSGGDIRSTKTLQTGDGQRVEWTQNIPACCPIRIRETSEIV